MAEHRPRPALLAALAALHVIVTAVTWRDLRRRSASQIRGSKRLWRVASAAQMGNSLAYWLIGRRDTEEVPTP